ncbi:MAG: hypothetical protein J7L11_10545 [Thermoprotei archaeon]|nr:hypothetical protein [Thermoprotei archaeon]
MPSRSRSSDDLDELIPLHERLASSLSMTLGILLLLMSINDLINGSLFALFGGLPLTLSGIAYVTSSLLLWRKYYPFCFLGIGASIAVILLTVFSYQPLEVTLTMCLATGITALLLFISWYRHRSSH